MYTLSDAIYHVAKSFSHVIGGKVIEDFLLPEVGKPPISHVTLHSFKLTIGLLDSCKWIALQATIRVSVSEAHSFFLSHKFKTLIFETSQLWTHNWVDRFLQVDRSPSYDPSVVSKAHSFLLSHKFRTLTFETSQIRTHNSVVRSLQVDWSPSYNPI